MTKAFKRPPTYYVFCSVPRYENPKELFTFRVGTTNDEKEVQGIIDADRKWARTSGPMDRLLGMTADQRRFYRAFKAEWNELDIKQ